MREEPSDSGSDLHPDEDYFYDPDKPKKLNPDYKEYFKGLDDFSCYDPQNPEFMNGTEGPGDLPFEEYFDIEEIFGRKAKKKQKEK